MSSGDTLNSIGEFYDSFEWFRLRNRLAQKAANLGRAAIEKAGSDTTPVIELPNGVGAAAQLDEDYQQREIIKLKINVAGHDQPEKLEAYAFVRPDIYPYTIEYYNSGLDKRFYEDKDRAVAEAFEVIEANVTTQ